MWSRTQIIPQMNAELYVNIHIAEKNILHMPEYLRFGGREINNDWEIYQKAFLSPKRKTVEGYMKEKS